MVAGVGPWPQFFRGTILPKSKRLAFLITIQLPIQTIVGYLIGFNWLSVIIVFGLIPVVDNIIGKDSGNPSDEDIKLLGKDRFFLLMPVLWVPLQLFILGYGAYAVSRELWPWYERIGMTVSVAILTGSGIIIAHEFGHRKTKWERLLAKILLATVSYMHFIIEHNQGHHVKVATKEDPSSARKGESFYRFLPRSIYGSYVSAWQIENRRLRGLGLYTFHWRNQMIWFALIPMVLAGGLYALWGEFALLFFAVQSFFAISMLELINYIEHYGLQRAEVAPGRYEKVTVRHSWNANQALSNIYMIHLERHSDHHAFPGLRYQCLRHRDESPQLPGGYGAMFPLALVPPLWFRFIDPLVEKYQSA